MKYADMDCAIRISFEFKLRIHSEFYIRCDLKEQPYFSKSAYLDASQYLPRTEIQHFQTHIVSASYMIRRVHTTHFY